MIPSKEIFYNLFAKKQSGVSFGKGPWKQDIGAL